MPKKSEMKAGSKILIDGHLFSLPRYLEAEAINFSYNYCGDVEAVKCKYTLKKKSFWTGDKTVTLEKWFDTCWITLIEA